MEPNRKGNPAVVNVYLKKSGDSNSSNASQLLHEVSFPNPEDLSHKYGIRSDANYLMASEYSIQNNIKDGSDLIDKTEVLIRKLAKKDQEIEKLCVLLETLEPIPGICAESMRKIIDNSAEEGADFRDSKIVSLAKKNRNLTVMLNKERASADSRGLIIQRLTDRVQQLEKGCAGVPKKVNTDPQEDPLLLRRELVAANKAVEEYRRKLFQSSEENKKLTRALSNELGENVTIEQAVEGTWRGRAQQIIMLKAKMKKMTTAIDDNTSIATQSIAASSSRTRRVDVDSMAQEELAEMSQERKHAIEFIIEEKEALLKGSQQLEEKINAQKARIRNLEADASRQKQQIKVVLDVKDGDDELIDALQQEIQRFKVQAKSKGPAGGAGAKASHISQISDADMDAITVDLARLRRLCKSQADQLSTQDDVIRGLRSRVG